MWVLCDVRAGEYRGQACILAELRRAQSNSPPQLELGSVVRRCMAHFLVEVRARNRKSRAHF